MKNCLLILSFLFTTIHSSGQAFITTWKTDNPGNSNSTSITIPTFSGATYNYDIDWDNDGVFEDSGITGDITHDYGVPGTYTIRIQGVFPRIYFNNDGDKDKILMINQWGSLEWSSMGKAFFGCNNLNSNAIDSPDLSNVTDMTDMFNGAHVFNGDLSSWDVSSVTSMTFAFAGASSFNSDISTWDVSNVTIMIFMFFGANSFNQNLGSWDISSQPLMNFMLDNSGLSITNYDNTLIGWESQMVSNLALGAVGLAFCNSELAHNSLINNYGWVIVDSGLSCPSGTIPFITTWTTDNPGSSNSTSITIPTFSGESYSYNIDWNNDGIFDEFEVTGDITHDFGVPGAYTVRVQGTFPRIYLNDTGDKQKLVAIEQWGNIEWSSMELAFAGAWNMINNASDAPDLSNVTDMSYMFSSAFVFDGDLSNWDVSNVLNFSNTFAFASSFNSDISNWNVGSAMYMTSMFGDTDVFNSDISNWDVSNVTHMGGMFGRASAFNIDLSSWDVSNVTSMGAMFSLATSFNQNLGNWIIHPDNNMSSMLNHSGLDTTNYDNTLIGWESQMINDRILGAAGLIYCNGEPARTSLINNYGWTITGDDIGMGCIPLPVEIELFEVRLTQSNHAELYWQTSSETNNSGYEIQRLKDGIRWSKIGFVVGHGTSTEISQYEYHDKRPMSGTNYYRLKQVDLDGTFEYSEAKSITLSQENSIEVSPNPTSGVFRLTGGEGTEVRIINSIGQVVKEIAVASQDVDISNLPDGIYFITISTEKGAIITTTQVIKN